MGVEVNLGRQMAMVNQCKRRGGGCTCVVGCKAETELLSAKSVLQSCIGDIESKLRWLRYRPATIRANWLLPTKPQGDYVLAVHNDGGEWVPHWTSDTESNDYIDIEGSAAWPFVEETAHAEDWEKAGFTVV